PASEISQRPSASFAREELTRRRRHQAEMTIRKRGSDPAAIGALEESLLDQERLEHVLDRVALLADRGREIVDADRSAGELVEYAAQKLPVHHVQARRVDVEHRQRGVRDFSRDAA